jgi:D-sorbitol dehydrogenase (acceptor)
VESKVLSGKVAIVTGAARGIGKGIAKRYVEEGALVAVVDVDAEEAEKTAAELDGRAAAFGCDISDPAASRAMVEQVCKRFGGIDVLVNNAGIFDMQPLLEITEADYDRIFGTNVRGMLFTLQAVAKEMVGRGTKGKIINISSQAGRRGEALVAVFCASKAAVISLTQSAGLALIKHGINVNGISPGVVDTSWDKVDALFAKYENRPLGEKKRLVGEAVPFGRIGQAEDLVGACVFLASPDADYIVAQTLNVDGGNWMS